VALIVETGAGLANANSYVSVADAQAIVVAYGFTIPNNATKCEEMLTRALQVLEFQAWEGVRSNINVQALCFPRSGVLLSDARVLGANSIPIELKRAQALLAYEIHSGNDPGAAAGPATISEKVDVIEIQYLASTVRTVTALSDLSLVWGLIAPMLKSAGAYRIGRA
jgi:hypothetical protein